MSGPLLGTFLRNADEPQSIAFPDITANSVVTLSVVSAEGANAGTAMVSAIEPGTGFQVQGSFGDRSVCSFCVWSPCLPISFAGQATLVSGAVTVSAPAVTSGSLIFLSRASGPDAAGIPYVSTIVEGVGFGIASTNGADGGVINFLAI